MARIIGYTLLKPGHFYPFVPILAELRKRGHRVLFATLGEESRQPGNVAGVGIRVKQWSLPSSAPGLDTLAQYGEPMVAALEDFLAEECPDLIVADPMLWGGMAAAEASGLPWASVAYTPKLFRALNVDVRGPGLRPPRGPIGLVVHRCIEAALRAAPEFSPLLNAVRTSRGLPKLSHPWDWFHLPPLTIATTAEPFEYPRTDWHPSLRFVGPLEWEPLADSPGWLNELDDRPLILLVGSSIPEAGPAQSWVRIAIEVLADEPYQVVATLPTDNIQEALPGNIRVERFTPHGLLLPRAACVICHGGPGITQKALAAGVPVVAVPFAHDRFEVARRVEVAGAGVMVPVRRLTQARLKAAVRGQSSAGQVRSELPRLSGGREAQSPPQTRLRSCWRVQLIVCRAARPHRPRRPSGLINTAF